MKLSQFKQDETKANEGVVRNFDTEGKCYIRVARANNPKFEKEIRTLSEPYKSFRKSKIPEKVMEEITKKAMAKCILLEMVGFEDGEGDIVGEKGAVIEDTFENRYKVLMHPAYKEFLEMISEISFDFNAFKVESEAEDEGN